MARIKACRSRVCACVNGAISARIGLRFERPRRCVWWICRPPRRPVGGGVDGGGRSLRLKVDGTWSGRAARAAPAMLPLKRRKSCRELVPLLGVGPA